MRGIILAGLVLVAGCAAPMGGAIHPDAIEADRRGAVVTGRVGANWGEDDLRANAFGAVCGTSGVVESVSLTRRGDGSATFRARCAS